MGCSLTKAPPPEQAIFRGLRMTMFSVPSKKPNKVSRIWHACSGKAEKCSRMKPCLAGERLPASVKPKFLKGRGEHAENLRIIRYHRGEA